MEENEQILGRKKKLSVMKERSVRVYPNDFSPTHSASVLQERFATATTEELDKTGETFSVAGRMRSLRHFGKAAFFYLHDRSGQIQVYVRHGVSPTAKVAFIQVS